MSVNCICIVFPYFTVFILKIFVHIANSGILKLPRNISIFPITKADLSTYNSKTCVKRPLKKDKTKILITNGSLMKVKSIVEIMLPLEHSAILLTCILIVIIGFKPVFGLFQRWPFYTGFTVYPNGLALIHSEWPKCIEIWAP